MPHGVGEGAVHEQAEAQHVDAVRQEGDALGEGTCSVERVGGRGEARFKRRRFDDESRTTFDDARILERDNAPDTSPGDCRTRATASTHNNTGETGVRGCQLA